MLFNLHSKYFFFGLLLLVGCNPAEVEEGTAALAVQKMPDKIDFNFHVKPILSDRCFHCHGPDDNSREAGLRLDTKEGAFAALGDAKDHFAIVAGSLEESSLVERTYTDDPEMMMPPPESNRSLSDYDKAILKQWIKEGAEWKEHWSFIPPQKPSISAVDDGGWASNEIDYFVFNKMDKAGITPSPQADKAHLLRRICFDLTGLPPTLAQMDAFMEDTSPNAIEKMIDDFLDTDAYAEQMTAKWLDLARYADTHGYQDDLERVMWPWRDWVIHAYKENMPFDQFVTWQLAGDLLPNPTKEQLIATAFNRNHKITQEGGVIPEEYRVEYVADRTQTFGIAFLGLTMECSRCHDHKYDPIYQKDYYSLYSFFNNIPEKGLIPNYGATPEPYITLTEEEIESTLSFINNVDSSEKIELMVMQEMEKPRQAYVLNRGGYDNYGDPVGPSTPAAVLAFEADLPANRLGLAEWLTDEDNPLMARVTVNRLWQQMFGRGIVATPEDFGNQGALPTHPDLLDYLSVKFIEDGWDVKKMVKFIAMSSTYQQSSVIPKALLEKDPENLLLARSPRKRLEAEMIRDHALAIGGLMVEQVGGPSVKPYQPEGLWAETTGGGGGSTSRYIQDTGSKLYRRSLYTFWKRTLPPPNMMTFDAASRDFCIVKRQNTSTPMQALILMNDPQIIEAGRALADRAIQSAPANLEERMIYMFRLSTSRYPTPGETSELKAYFGEELQRFSANKEDAEAYLGVGEYVVQSDLGVDEMAAYAILANAIFNLDESITKS